MIASQLRLGIACAAQNTVPALVERHASIGGERVTAEHEPLVLPQKEHASASRHQALDLPLGALSVRTQPAEIVVPAGAEHEDVDLVVGDAGPTALMKVGDGPAAGAVEGGKVVKAVDCDSQVDVSALVQNFDPEPPEGPKRGSSRSSGWATEPNRVTARTSAKAAKAAATASAARRSTACRMSW
jgi:hypothetical protein